MVDNFLAGAGETGLVSIIVPTYNRGHLIRDTIDSILGQSYAHFEAIIVDDGSGDDTRQVVADYSDARIRYFYKENGGLSSARNFGLDQAQGEFIAFLDSDNVWEPWKLGAQIQIFRRHPEVGLVWSDMSSFATPGQILEERHLRTYYAAYQRVDIASACPPAGTVADIATDAPAQWASSPYHVGQIFRGMFFGNLVHPPTAIVARERLRRSGRFQPEITGRGGEDYHFYWRIAEGGAVAFLDAPTTLYRVGDPWQLSGARNLIHEARGNLAVLLHWLPHFVSTLPRTVLRDRLAASYAWVGTEELHAGNHRVAASHFWRSLRLRPRQGAVAVLLGVSFLPPRVVPLLGPAKNALANMMTPAGLIRLTVGVSAAFYLLYRLISILQPELADG